MSAIRNKLERYESIKSLGMAQARKEFSNVINSSVNDDKISVISHGKMLNAKNAYVIGEEMLKDILKFIRFNPLIEHVDGDVQISYEDFGFYGIGNNMEDATSDLLESVKYLVVDYFSEDQFPINMRYENTRKVHPYYLKLATCHNDACLREALGLQHS